MQQRMTHKKTQIHPEHDVQPNVQRQEKTEESLNVRTHEPNPLESITCRIGDGACAAKHGFAIQRTGLFHPMNGRQKVRSLLNLQRQYGNRFVQRVIAQHAIQTKLQVSQPGDAYEQEADQVADAVMQMPEPFAIEKSPVSGQAHSDQIQQMPETESPEEESTRAVLRIICPECEEELFQAKEVSNQLSELTPNLESRIQTLKEGGQPLPGTVRASFEERFGYDFSNVRVHTDAGAAETAKGMHALAYTVGSHIVFAPGQYAPNSSLGKRLLAHELTHVAQQNPHSRHVQTKGSTSKAIRNEPARASHKRAMLNKDSVPVKISKQANPDWVYRHTAAYCEEMYEICCDGCRSLPNRTKRDKARRALCWSRCMAEYAACLASSEEALAGALTFAAIVAAIVLASADGPFPVGDAAAVALLLSLGISL